MTLVEAINLFGSIPKTGLLHNGVKLTLDYHKNHCGDYVATLWADDHIYSYAIGGTEKEAHDNLKEKLLTLYS